MDLFRFKHLESEDHLLKLSMSLFVSNTLKHFQALFRTKSIRCQEIIFLIFLTFLKLLGVQGSRSLQILRFQSAKTV